jgi:hypothetical protein
MLDIAEMALKRQARSRKLRPQLQAGISIDDLDRSVP